MNVPSSPTRQRAFPFFRNHAAVWLLIAAAVWPGCGQDDPTSFRVRGTVTYQGEPVPRGIVYFDPDPARNNRGPQGYAIVEHGEYDTAGRSGRGIVGGPYRVRVSGFNGLNRSEMMPYGSPLFAEQLIEKDFAHEDSVFDIDIP